MRTITSTDEACRIAAEWQSPGTIGHVLATLASRLPVDRDALWLDVDATIHHDNPTGSNLEELEALQEWAEHGHSQLLTAECEGHESLDGAHMGKTVYCDGTCRS